MLLLQPPEGWDLHMWATVASIQSGFWYFCMASNSMCNHKLYVFITFLKFLFHPHLVTPVLVFSINNYVCDHVFTFVATKEWAVTQWGEQKAWGGETNGQQASVWLLITVLESISSPLKGWPHPLYWCYMQGKRKACYFPPLLWRSWPLLLPQKKHMWTKEKYF